MTLYHFNENHSILGNLYYLLNAYGIFNERFEYIDFLIGKSNYANESLWSLIVHKDYLSGPALSEAKNNITKAEKFCQTLENILNNVSSKDADNIKNALTIIIDNVSTYQDRSHTYMYCLETKRSLLTYYTTKNECYSLPYSIYLLIHFAVYKKLPSNYYYGIKYRADLDEFNREVTNRYGVNSPNGARAIFRLTQKNNIIALYEYADILYYGKSPSGHPDYNKCYEYLRKSAGLDIQDNINLDSCNPLALWLLAYINYNYHYRLDLKNIPPIPELETKTFGERVDSAIILAKQSFELNNNVCASNLLGIITYNENKSLQEKYNLKSPEEYFQYAADYGYMFAYNNLSNIALDKLFADENNQEKHLQNYISNLTSASEYYCNWSSNQLGLFYLTGEVKIKHHSEEMTGCFPAYINREKAKSYFQRACIFEHDDATAWALSNLLVYFKEDYDNYQNTDLIINHINRIIRLKNIKALNFVKAHLPNLKLLIKKCESENDAL